MSGVYNVSKIILNGQTISGVDVSTLGINTQKVPSSFAVKNEINKLKKSILDTIVEELEIYKIPEMTSTFVDVPGYPGVKVGLALLTSSGTPTAGSVINKYVDASKLTGKVAEEAIVYQTTSVNQGTKVYSSLEDSDKLEGWIVKLSPVEMTTGAYRIPRKIFLNNKDTSSDMKIIKIIIDDTSNLSSDKRKLTSIYAPDVVVFGTTDELMKKKNHSSDQAAEDITDEWLYETVDGSNPPVNHISTDWAEHTRIDITTKAFTGEFYPPMNQDIVLHNQEVIDLKHVIAIEKTSASDFKYGLVPNMNLTDNYNTCVHNIDGYSATLTVPLCDYSIGLEKTDEVYGFSDIFIEKSRLEIPKDCKLSYKLETLHSHHYTIDDTESDTGHVLYYVIRTDCFESDYLSAAYVTDHEIQIPVKRYRMISENEYFLTEYFGLKNSMLFDMLEQKEHEAFDKLGHLHLKKNISDTPVTFEYENIKLNINDFEESAVYLSRKLRADDQILDLKLTNPTGLTYTVNPEIEHTILAEYDGYFVVTGVTAGAAVNNVVNANVILSNYVNTSGTYRFIDYSKTEGSTTTYGYFGSVHNATQGTQYTKPEDFDDTIKLSPMFTYTNDLSDIIDYTQYVIENNTTKLVQQHNHNLILTTDSNITQESNLVKAIFNLTDISTLEENTTTDYYSVIKRGDSFVGFGPFKTPSDFETKIKLQMHSNYQLLFVKSKLEVTGATYPVLEEANLEGTLLGFNANAKLPSLISVSDQINNRFIGFLAQSPAKTINIYYPDIRSLGEIITVSGVVLNVYVNHDALQLCNKVNGLFVNYSDAKKIDKLYLLPGALQHAMDFNTHNLETSPFDLSLVCQELYVPQGYDCKQLSTVFKLPTVVKTFDATKLM